MADITPHKLLTRKWRQTDIQSHYRRMQNAKPTVECHNSKLSFPHLIVKSKKIQLSEGK